MVSAGTGAAPGFDSMPETSAESLVRRPGKPTRRTRAARRLKRRRAAREAG